MTEPKGAFMITAIKSPNWDEDEVKRRLGRAYMLILNYTAQETADRGEFGDLTRPAADDAPAVKPEAQDAL